MPEISEQDFAALAAQVASLSSALAVARRRIDDLEDGMTGHIGLDWGESLVDVNSPHPNISVNTIESGGGLIRQDTHAMQIRTGGTSRTGIYWQDEFVADPTQEEAQPQSSISGKASNSTDSATVSLAAFDNTGDSRSLITVATNDGGGDYSEISLAVTRAGSGSSGDTYLSLIDDADTSTAYISLYGSIRFSRSLTPSQITSNQDNYDPAGLMQTAALRLSTDASRDITGIAGGADGRMILIFNVGSFDIVLKDEDAGSTAANRFALQADITVPPDGAAILWYDSASSRWRCVGTY